MDEGLSEVESRLDAVEREVWELRLRLAALSRGGGGRGVGKPSLLAELRFDLVP